MKSFIISFLLFFVVTTGYAQDSLRQQAIYLVDGSVLKATILDRSAEFTRVKIISGDVLLLNNSLITNIDDKVVISFNAPPSTVPGLSRRSALQEKGWYNIFSTGLLLGRDAQLEDGLIASFSALHYVFGYQFNQYIGLGVGAGVDLYGPAYFPLYVDIRGNQNWRKKTFFYSFQSGYSFSEDAIAKIDDGTEHKGGLMLYPAIGMRFPSYGQTDILLEFGYRHQWAKRNFPWSENEDNIQFRRYTLRVGLSF